MWQIQWFQISKNLADFCSKEWWQISFCENITSNVEFLLRKVTENWCWKMWEDNETLQIGYLRNLHTPCTIWIPQTLRISRFPIILEDFWTSKLATFFRFWIWMLYIQSHAANLEIIRLILAYLKILKNC